MPTTESPLDNLRGIIAAHEEKALNLTSMALEALMRNTQLDEPWRKRSNLGLVEAHVRCATMEWTHVTDLGEAVTILENAAALEAEHMEKVPKGLDAMRTLRDQLNALALGVTHD